MNLLRSICHRIRNSFSILHDPCWCAVPRDLFSLAALLGDILGRQVKTRGLWWLVHLLLVITSWSCENREHQGTLSHGVRTQNTRALCHMVCWFNSWLSHQWSVSSWLLLRWVTFHWFSTWYVTNHAGQLSLLPSVGWETSSSQGSVAVLCGQKCKKWSHTAHVADSGAVAPSSVNFNHSVKKFTDSSPILSYWSRLNNTYSLQYLSWNRLSTIKLFF